MTHHHRTGSCYHHHIPIHIMPSLAISISIASQSLLCQVCSIPPTTLATPQRSCPTCAVSSIKQPHSHPHILDRHSPDPPCCHPLVVANTALTPSNPTCIHIPPLPPTKASHHGSVQPTAPTQPQLASNTSITSTYSSTITPTHRVTTQLTFIQTMSNLTIKCASPRPLHHDPPVHHQ